MLSRKSATWLHRHELTFVVESDDDPFALRLWRAADGATLLDTTATRLVFKDQYIELTTWLHETVSLYGAGERASDALRLRRNGLPRAIWARDLGPTFLESNSYGSHPFVLALAPDGTAFGLFLLSSSGLEIVPAADRLSWRAVGGAIDLFVLAGPTPLDVMDQLTQVVGRPAMMPLWALGWHQSRYGYKSVWEVQGVVEEYARAGIPLEAMWSDIDHMDRWKDFTFDPVNYPVPEMQRLVAELHARGQKWVPIVDPALKVEAGYAPYERALRRGAFMRGLDGGAYLGWVWPGAVHYIDFLAASARHFFSELLAEHHALVPWSGLWIDMNEPSNFCTGDACTLRPDAAAAADDPPPWECRLDCPDVGARLNATQRGFLSPPYPILNGMARQPLGTKTLSVLAFQLDGTLQYNYHNLYGLATPLAVHAAALNATGKRPFVLSRSSFTGTGAYAAHWTGDNAATWQDMARSLPGVLSIGLQGMPMAGADVCGFLGDTHEELCARWVSLGAFYPFARSHSDLHSAPQEPFRWPAVAAAARAALATRYSLLPYLYSAFREAHARGAPVMRPLWLNFPEDGATHGVDRQFMLGASLLLTPVLEAGAGAVRGYFPGGTTWHELAYDTAPIDARAGGLEAEVGAPLGTIPVHVAGGSVVAAQPPALTTAQVRRGALTPVVALRCPVRPGQGAAAQRAAGWMYIDDGDEPEAGATDCHFLHFQASTWYDSAAIRHRGELLLSFGRGKGGGGGGAAAACDSAVAWPPLGGVKVLGWGAGVEDMHLETPARGGVRSLRVEGARVAQGSGRVAVHLSAAQRPALRCPGWVRLAWESPAQLPAQA